MTDRRRPHVSPSLAETAQGMGLRIRTLERAVFVRRLGVPELITLVKAGKLTLLPASWLARLPHAEQRELIAKHDPETLCAFATILRKETEREHGRSLRDLKRAWRIARPADRTAFRAWIATQEDGEDEDGDGGEAPPIGGPDLRIGQ
jgi:hypothetical protein